MSKRLLVAGVFLAGLLAGVTLRAGLGLTQSGAPDAEVVYAIDHAADANGLSRRFLHCLAQRESTWRPWAVGDYGAAHGLYQFHWGTWRWASARYGFAGYSPYHAWAAAHVAAGLIADGGRGHWPPARYCGSERW